MKTKICEVLLVAQSKKELNNWIDKIKDKFDKVSLKNFRKCFFEEENISDYRVNVQFQSTDSINSIYKEMNNIKSNPIKFLN